MRKEGRCPGPPAGRTASPTPRADSGPGTCPAARAPTARCRTHSRRPAPLPRPPAPSPAASSRSPSPFPPRVGDVKIPRKSRVVAPRAEARFRRPAAPSRARRGEGEAPRLPIPFPPGKQGPADAASQAPPAPNLIGRFTFRKLMHFQSYFRPREACLAAESDRKRGKFGSFYLFIFFFQGRGVRC